MNFLSDLAYLAVKPQASPDTPVIPTIHFPLVSESIEVEPNIEADRRMMGLDWKSNDVLKGARQISGDLVVLGDVNVMAHIFNMMHLKGSTTGNGTDGYTHPFGNGEGDQYTIEVPRGSYAVRYWGVRGDSLVLNFVDYKLQATLTIKALGVFESATIAVALTGAGMTSAKLKQDGILEPNKGLIVGDVIIIGSTEVTLTSVNADGITVGFASTSITASVGDAVYLKKQTPSFGTQLKPLFLNDVLVGIGADSSAADTSAASKTTAIPCSDIEIEFKNNLLEAMQSGITGAGQLLNQVRECQVRVNRLFETPDQQRKWLEMLKQAMTIVMRGQFIKSDFTTWQLLTLKFNRIKLTDNKNELKTGEYVFDEQEFEALYDTSDGVAFTATIVNTIAGTVL